MEKYIDNIYSCTYIGTGSVLNGGRDILLHIGDKFRVIKFESTVDSQKRFFCEYLGPYIPERVGEQFVACTIWIDSRCSLVGPSELQEPDLDSVCRCSSSDLAGVGHSSDCAFMLAGGCRAKRN